MTKKPKFASLADVEVLVYGDRVWGRGPTLAEAEAKAGRPRKYVAFLVHKDTYVDDLGSLQFPLPFTPREIFRQGVPPEKKEAARGQAAEAGDPGRGRARPGAAPKAV